MKNNTYYIYRWVRLDKNTPFYIGKGTGKRAFRVKGKRNQYFTNIVNKINCKCQILIDNLTEEEAFQKEKQLIKLYKTYGYCEANLTLGGEGASGLKHSPETISKRVASMRRVGRKPTSQEARLNHSKWQIGRKLSDTHRANMSKAGIGRKVSLETRLKRSKKVCIKNIFTHEIVLFNSVSEFKEKTGISRDIYQRLVSNKIKTPKNKELKEFLNQWVII